MAERVKKLAFSTETKQNIEKELKKIDTTVFLVLLTVGLSLLDFYSHPNGGVADLERRKMLQDVLGPFMRHLGNYGFSAAPAIAAIFGKELINSLTQNNKIKKITKQGFLTFIASIITANALFEVFPKNAEGPLDFVVGAMGVGMGILAAQMAIEKFKKARLAREVV